MHLAARRLGAAVLALTAMSAVDASTGLEVLVRSAALCSSSNPLASGLRGVYVVRSGSAESTVTRVEAPIDFDPSLASTLPGAKGAQVAVHWSGWVKAPLSGRYRFHLDAPGASVKVAQQDMTGGTADAELTAGRFYPVEITVPRLPAIGGEPIRFEWTVPHGARYVVPKALLHLPHDSVAAR